MAGITFERWKRRWERNAIAAKNVGELYHRLQSKKWLSNLIGLAQKAETGTLVVGHKVS